MFPRMFAHTLSQAMSLSTLKKMAGMDAFVIVVKEVQKMQAADVKCML